MNQRSVISATVRDATENDSVQQKAVEYQHSNWPQPEKSFSRIHVDFAGPINGQRFLVVDDEFNLEITGSQGRVCSWASQLVIVCFKCAAGIPSRL
ncbi:hypothetical protein T265_03748 [Opisthorchis viverrini]|uniref:Uncharacterized protein n=1 Tax=Opisthorchis viverrini TaxID=6198 RepID=A0A074ZQQ5_OPIVI|nr:hypothetical protein T265_03748 [Opisthorchis viverrini]KER29733.1 hypothetical protein T265_03748 [Opisthorchis viverrini]